MNDIEILKNKVFESVTTNAFNHLVCFIEKNTKKVYFLYHIRDCCESVDIEDICGDLSDLEDTPLLLCEEVTQEGGCNPSEGSYTWTFYKFSTIKGTVTIRWYGESNGYYSEEVNLVDEKDYPYGWEFDQFVHLYTVGFLSLDDLLKRFKKTDERLDLIEHFGVIIGKSSNTWVINRSHSAINDIKNSFRRGR